MYSRYLCNFCLSYFKAYCWLEKTIYPWKLLPNYFIYRKTNTHPPPPPPYPVTSQHLYIVQPISIQQPKKHWCQNQFINPFTHRVGGQAIYFKFSLNSVNSQFYTVTIPSACRVRHSAVFTCRLCLGNVWFFPTNYNSVRILFSNVYLYFRWYLANAYEAWSRLACTFLQRKCLRYKLFSNLKF